MSALIRVEIACASQDEADGLAKALLDARLAACIQSLAVTSRYHWQGKIERSQEILLIAKSRMDLFNQICAKVSELHSYDVAEISCVEMKASPAYTAWVRDGTS